MKPEGAVESIARFFNDLIGAIVPAGVLALGLLVLHSGPDVKTVLSSLDSAIGFLCVVGALFATGHVLLAIFEQILKKPLTKVRLLTEFDEELAKTHTPFRLFRRLTEKSETLKLGENESDWNYRDLRNVALTVSSTGEGIGRRFMFLSLFCNGTGTALLLLAADFTLCRWVAPHLLHPYPMAPHWLVQLAILVAAAGLLFRRAELFRARAMTAPFAVAVGVIAFERDTKR